MTHRLAMVTGASGQDARYLAEQLAAAGSEVVGTSHGEPPPDRGPFGAVERLDLCAYADVLALIRRLRPTHVYNCLLYTSPSPRD